MMIGVAVHIQIFLNQSNNGVIKEMFTSLQDKQNGVPDSLCPQQHGVREEFLLLLWQAVVLVRRHDRLLYMHVRTCMILGCRSTNEVQDRGFCGY